MRMPGSASRLARPVVDLTHLIHVDERIEVGEVDAGERTANRESLRPRSPDGAVVMLRTGRMRASSPRPGKEGTVVRSSTVTAGICDPPNVCPAFNNIEAPRVPGQVRAGSGGGCDNECRGGGLVRTWTLAVPPDRRLRLPVGLRGDSAGGTGRQHRVDVPAAVRLTERVRCPARSQCRAASGSVRHSQAVPTARRYLPGTNVLETSWGTKTGWLIVRDLLVIGPWHHEDDPVTHAPTGTDRLRRRSRPAPPCSLRQRRGPSVSRLRADVRLRTPGRGMVASEQQLPRSNRHRSRV